MNPFKLSLILVVVSVGLVLIFWKLKSDLATAPPSPNPNVGFLNINKDAKDNYCIFGVEIPTTTYCVFNAEMARKLPKVKP